MKVVPHIDEVLLLSKGSHEVLLVLWGPQLIKEVGRIALIRQCPFPLEVGPGQRLVFYCSLLDSCQHISLLVLADGSMNDQVLVQLEAGLFVEHDILKVVGEDGQLDKSIAVFF